MPPKKKTKIAKEDLPLFLHEEEGDDVSAKKKCFAFILFFASFWFVYLLIFAVEELAGAVMYFMLLKPAYYLPIN